MFPGRKRVYRQVRAFHQEARVTFRCMSVRVCHSHLPNDLDGPLLCYWRKLGTGTFEFVTGSSRLANC